MHTGDSRNFPGSNEGRKAIFSIITDSLIWYIEREEVELMKIRTESREARRFRNFELERMDSGNRFAMRSYSSNSVHEMNGINRTVMASQRPELGRTPPVLRPCI
jgi:hypothetical protein